MTASVVTTASHKDAAFVAGHEGLVLKAYLCPAGVVTIGFGFTMGSRVFAAWWTAKHGRPLRLGDRISAEDATMLLRRLIDEEYGAAVVSKVEPRKQHHFGGAASVSYNCGPGALNWRWAQALARGDVAESARLLTTTAVTANGRRLAGLVRRRQDEAALIRDGDYGTHSAAPQFAPSASRSSSEVKEYQAQLKTLGYYNGAIDGLAGPVTRAAVERFQTEHGLTVDGIVGPATRATLIRALDARNTGTASGGAGGVTGAAKGGADVVTGPEPTPALDGLLSALPSILAWGVGIAAIVFVAFLIFRYRGRLTGRRVPT